MYGYIHKTDEQVNSARGAVYKLYEGQPKQAYDAERRSLLESARHFFKRNRVVGPVKAFHESLTPSVKPEWLLWAISQALPQADHNNIVIQTRVKPQSPPWR